MARVDSDTVTIVKTSYDDATTGFELELDWFDSLGEPKGRFGFSFQSEEEARTILDSQTIEDVIRPIIAFLFNRADGGFRKAVFTNMPTKTYEIQSTVRQV